MDTFLPEGGREVNNYMKFEEGDNKFRILSNAIGGYLYWNEDKDGNRKPVRKHLDEDLVLSEIQEPDKVKKFWAFIVWNYKEETIQILEITQKVIKQSIQGFIGNKKFGSPIDKYDIVVNRKGTGLSSKYIVQADPPDISDKKIADALKAKPINLEALFLGADPFMITKNDMNENVKPSDIPL